jgi:hypothetical protein
MRRTRTLLNWLTVVALVMLPLGCATKAPRPDTATATLAAPAEQVKTALVQVLREGGYDVTEEDIEDKELQTGYRQENKGPWNWMLRSRFGTGRSWIDATITPDSETMTSLTIEVTHEGKDSLFTFWKPYEPPLAQNAANQIRLVKQALGLL